MPRRRWTILVAFAAWTLLVWATRIDNIWADEALSSSDKVGRTLLALSFVAVAGGLVVVAVRTFRHPPRAADLRAVTVASAWTIGVWVVRSVGIALADHGVAFITVHLVLGLISSGLALASVWAIRSSRSLVARPTGVATG